MGRINHGDGDFGLWKPPFEGNFPFRPELQGVKPAPCAAL